MTDCIYFKKKKKFEKYGSTRPDSQPDSTRDPFDPQPDWPDLNPIRPDRFVMSIQKVLATASILPFLFVRNLVARTKSTRFLFFANANFFPSLSDKERVLQREARSSIISPKYNTVNMKANPNVKNCFW